MTDDPLARNSCQSSPRELQQFQALQIYIFFILAHLTDMDLLGTIQIPEEKNEQITDISVTSFIFNHDVYISL